MKPNKFEIGQKIKFINDPDTKAGIVQNISFDGTDWIYKITGKSVDMVNETVEDGFKTGREDEFIEVKEIEVKEEQ